MPDVKDRYINLKNYKENLFKQNYGGIKSQGQAEQFFLRIYGLNDFKELMYLTLTALAQMNVLLNGSPASAKSMFISTIQEQCNDILYFDASNKNSTKLIDEIDNNKESKVIIIDEIDKLQISNYNSPLGLLKNGRVSKTTKTKRIDFEMENVKIFATSTRLEKISKEIRSLFLPYQLPEYLEIEFIENIKYYLQNKLFVETSEVIAKELIAHERKDVKAAISISKLLHNGNTLDEIDQVIGNWIKNNS